MIVLDASALVEVLLRTPAADGLTLRLRQPSETVHSPHLVNLEVAQTLRRYSAAGALSARRANEAFEDLAAFPMTLYSHQPFLKRIWELRHNVTAYDATYIALAEALNAPLVTCDRALASAPGHRARVESV